jgi:hypothetical protein
MKKAIKICSTSLFIGEMQTQSTVSCHFIPTKMAVIKKTEGKKVLVKVGNTGLLINHYWEREWGSRPR